MPRRRAFYDIFFLPPPRRFAAYIHMMIRFYALYSSRHCYTPLRAAEMPRLLVRATLSPMRAHADAMAILYVMMMLLPRFSALQRVTLLPLARHAYRH